MLLIQQFRDTLNKLTCGFNHIVGNCKNLEVSSATHEQALCNHKAALEALQADVKNIDDKVTALEEADPAGFASPIVTSTSVVPNYATSLAVLLPLNVDLVSLMLRNNTAVPTEELGIANHTVSSDLSNTIVTVYFSGIQNADIFNLIIKYIQL